MNQKGFTPKIIILGIVLILIIVGGVYFYGKTAYLKLYCPFGIVVNNECGWNWAPPLSSIYTCPENGYQNCMPILDAEGQKQCTKEALEWKQANCPNFSGAAY